MIGLKFNIFEVSQMSIQEIQLFPKRNPLFFENIKFCRSFGHNNQRANVDAWLFLFTPQSLLGLERSFFPVRFLLFYSLKVEKNAVNFLQPDRTPVFFSDDLRNDKAWFIMS